MVTKGFFSSLSPVQQEAALAYDGPENHGPDFFAESAKNPDHIVDADKMVSAGLPSEEEMTMLVDGAPVAVGSCEPEMSELASLGYVEQFKERVGLVDRPTWRITSAGREAARAHGE